MVLAAEAVETQMMSVFGKNKQTTVYVSPHQQAVGVTLVCVAATVQTAMMSAQRQKEAGVAVVHLAPLALRLLLAV